MSQGDQPRFGGVVTGKGAGRSFKLPLLIGGGVLALLVLGGGAFYVTKYGPLAPKPPQIKRENMTPAQQLTAAKEELAKASTPKQKQEAYTALGDAYRAGGQTSNSTAAYETALTYMPPHSTDDIPLLERLSGEYEDAGDKTNAVKTLQQLVDLLSASTYPDKDFLLSRYNAELLYYQGKR